MRIDLNSDLGEHYGIWRLGDDDAMLRLVSSANVACGFHAGDPSSLLETLRRAREQGVVVGAHVSYPDRVGFGRRRMEVDSRDLRADVIYQIGALQALAKAAGLAVEYVKPHGGLYNTIASDSAQAAAVIDAIQAVDPSLPLVCLAGAPIVGQAEAAGIWTIPEAFADRAYNEDGSLCDRREAGSVLHDPTEVADRMLRLVRDGVVEARSGVEVAVDARSICVHGDTAGAVELAQAVRERLVAAGVEIVPFAGNA